MDEEVIRRRNVMFAIVYRKTTSIYPVYVPKFIRWLFEAVILLMGIAALYLWGYIHFTYVVDPEDCLVEIDDHPFPYDEILQVEVYTNSTDLWNKRHDLLVELYESLSHPGRDSYFNSDAEHRNKLPLTNFLLSWLYPSDESEREDIEENMGVGNATGSMEGLDYKIDVATTGHHSLYELFDIYTLKHYSLDYTILEFSQEPGYLSLTQSARTRLNITTRKIYINPENSTCFGGPFGQFITKYFIGYEMMIIGSFKNLLPAVQGSGYVKNLLNSNQYYYRVQWMGKWRYFAGILPTLFFTLVASVLLRQIHYHVFKFLTHFQHLLNEGIPMPIQTGAQIPFLIITYAAIGLIIVMSEALGDDSLFSLLMVATVWEADQYYAVFCKHPISKFFFPIFFFMYHFIPYAYFIRFNGQFWFIPFVFHWILLQHSMLFMFHHYEINSNQIQPLAAGVLPQRGHPPERFIHLPEQPVQDAEAQGDIIPRHQEFSDTEQEMGRELRRRRQPQQLNHDMQTARPATVGEHVHLADELDEELDADLETSIEESCHSNHSRSQYVIVNTSLEQVLQAEPPDSQQTYSQALLHGRMLSTDCFQKSQLVRNRERRGGYGLTF